jgi:hypothetical protein
MLYPVALKYFGRTIVHSDWHGHSDRSLGIHQALAEIVRDLQVIRDQVKLIASHFESWVTVNVLHRWPDTTRAALRAALCDSGEELGSRKLEIHCP